MIRAPETLQLTLGEAITAVSRIETVPVCYEAFYQGLYLAATTGAPLPVKAEEARISLQVIELALQSVREKRVIDFPDSGKIDDGA